MEFIVISAKASTSMKVEVIIGKVSIMTVEEFQDMEFIVISAKASISMKVEVIIGKVSIMKVEEFQDMEFIVFWQGKGNKRRQGEDEILSFHGLNSRCGTRQGRGTEIAEGKPD
jgi:hypothetical protein